MDPSPSPKKRPRWVRLRCNRVGFHVPAAPVLSDASAPAKTAKTVTFKPADEEIKEAERKAGVLDGEDTGKEPAGK